MFSEAEINQLKTQRLARVATAIAERGPQGLPSGFPLSGFTLTMMGPPMITESAAKCFIPKFERSP